MNAGFFTEGKSFDVEARSSDGLRVTPDSRGVVQWGKRIAKSLAHAATALTVASAPAAAATNDFPDFKSLPVLASPASLLDDYPSLQTITSGMTESSLKAIGSIKFQRNSFDPSETPSMAAVLNESGKPECRMNMYGMDGIYRLMEEGRSKLSVEQKQRSRVLVALHEIAHCEYALGVHKQIVTKEPTIQGAVDDYLTSNIQLDTPNLSLLKTQISFGVDLNGLIHERNSDAKALLVTAKNIFKGAGPNDTDASRKAGLDLFDLNVEDLKLLRESDREKVDHNGKIPFNDHDTYKVIIRIQEIVHEGVTSNQSLKHFQESKLNGDAATNTALEVTLGSVRAEKEQLIPRILAASASVYAHINRVRLDDIAAKKIELSQVNNLTFNDKLTAFQRAELLQKSQVLDAQIDLEETNLIPREDCVQMFLASPEGKIVWADDAKQSNFVRQLLNKSDDAYKKPIEQIGIRSVNPTNEMTPDQLSSMNHLKSLVVSDQAFRANAAQNETLQSPAHY